ncbi:MAG TPA: DUF1801 domain-containing protein [Fimbriimonadaceae bacterium]|nr:DUF1801 domain-containing protein [Fimbriimonadaceae bacterium]
MRPSPPEYLAWLEPYSDAVRELALAAREFAVSRAPDATEIVANATYAVSMGLSYTHTHVKGFIYVAAYRDYVNFGFTYGASFDDPEGRLQGTGNQSRHIKLRSLADLDDPYFSFLFDQALNRAHRPDPPLEPTVVLMKYESVAKRRPTPR